MRARICTHDIILYGDYISACVFYAVGQRVFLLVYACHRIWVLGRVRVERLPDGAFII